METTKDEQNKKYRTYKCAVCGKVGTTRAETPRCGACGSRRVNLTEKPARKVAAEDPDIDHVQESHPDLENPEKTGYSEEANNGENAQEEASKEDLEDSPATAPTAEDDEDDEEAEDDEYWG